MAEVPRKPVTLNLRTYVAEHLDELARLTGSTPDQVVESAIEERYAKRAHLAAGECPWEITDQAKTDYLWIVGARATQESLAAAEEVLRAAAIDAAQAELAGQRFPSVQEGVLRYRGPKPHRLSLHVEPGGEGARPRLVKVRGR